MNSITHQQDYIKLEKIAPFRWRVVHLSQEQSERNEVMSEQGHSNDKGNTWGGDSIPFDGAPMVADPVSEQEEYGLEARG